MTNDLGEAGRGQQDLSVNLVRFEPNPPGG